MYYASLSVCLSGSIAGLLILFLQFIDLCFSKCFGSILLFLFSILIDIPLLMIYSSISWNSILFSDYNFLCDLHHSTDHKYIVLTCLVYVGSLSCTVKYLSDRWPGLWGWGLFGYMWGDRLFGLKEVMYLNLG